MENKIVFQGKIDSITNIIVRYPTSNDAKQMTDYINTLSEERTFITYQGETETLEKETKFLNSKLDKIKDHKSVMLLLFCGNELVGISGIDLGTRTEKHVGTLGISIAKNYRGKGIGKFFLKTIEDEAIKELPDLEIIFLSVFANNKKAIKMYENAGYKIFGTFPKGIKLENGYVDQIYKYKNLK